MASLQHRPDRPRPYRVRWRDATGRARSRSFHVKRDAVRYLHELQAAVDRGTYPALDAGRVAFADLAAAWLDGKHAADRKASTIADYDSLLRTWILSALGGLPVALIDIDTITSLARDLADAGLSASRRRRAIGVTAGILDLGIRRGHATVNPARLVDRPPIPPRTRHRYLDHGQVHRLADATGPYAPLILTLAYTGLRWGEATALTGSDVDRARGLIHVDRAASEVGGRIAYTSPKSHQRRDVPAPDLVLDRLPDTTGLLFTTSRNKPLRGSNFRKGIWTPALESTGLTGLRIHDLRHTAASLARAAGADAFTVARMLGHADASITARTYADLFDVELGLLRTRMQAAAEQALGHTRATTGTETEGIPRMRRESG